MERSKKLLHFLVWIILLTGCVSEQTDTPPPVEVVTPVATQLPEVENDQSEMIEDWEISGHAQAKDVIDCDACHQVKNGSVIPGIVWWNQDLGEYEIVSDGNELCVKCHAEYNNAETVHVDLTCLDCHETHSNAASCFGCHYQLKWSGVEVQPTPSDGHPNGDTAFCEGSGCHSVATQVANVANSIHGSTHAMVTCVACHASEGNPVGPLPGGTNWVLWREGRDNGDDKLKPYQSHNLQFEVDCARCHFETNPWGLQHIKGSGFKN